jgi:tetratricopeptide (TPR) repeat protein
MPRRLSLLIFISLLTLCSLHAKPDVSRIEFYYGIAEGNYLIGDLKGAANAVEQMLKLDPDYVPALTLNTRIQIDQGHPEAALKSAERAIALEADNQEHQLLKALVLGNMDQRDEAIVLIQQVMETAPVDSDDYRVASKLLGLLLMAEGNWDTAADTFNQIYLNNPETAEISLELASEAYLEKARNALNQGDSDAAVDAITQALEVHAHERGDSSFKQRTQLRMMRARVLTQVGRLDEAIADLQFITNQQPDNLEAFVTLASLYASAERWESLQGIIAPIAEKPELKDIALYLQGRAALAKNRAGTARELFEDALRLLPDGPSQLRTSLEFYHGVCFDMTGRQAEGDAEILKALDSGFRPETANEAILASRALLRAKQTARAIEILEAITLNQISPSAEAWTLLGRAHLTNGSTALALSALNQSLSIDLEQAATLALRGSLLRKLGDLEGAAADTESALLLDPGSPELTYSLGLIRFQQGDLIAAENWIGQSAQQLAENPGIQLLHALLAYAIGDPATAQTALNDYLRLVPQRSNDSACYLEYILTASQDPGLALLKLKQRIESSDAISPNLKNFLAYIEGELDRKAVLDAAGRAETPQLAQQQICEVAFWLAQYEQLNNHPENVAEYLKLAIQIGTPDMAEYQFAKWQSTRINPELQEYLK